MAEILKEVIAEFDPQLANAMEIKSVTSEEHYGAAYQDVARRVPSIKEAQTKLNWTPKVSLKESLRRILAYHLNGVDPDAELLKSIASK